jgi:RND superfamily putative drug exporter
MFGRIARLAIRWPRLILGIAALIVILTAVLGVPVANHLSSGGFEDPASESARSAQLLGAKFGQSGQQLLLTVSDQAGITGGAAQSIGTEIAGQLAASPNVLSVSSPWTSPPAAAAELISKDGKTGLVVATLAGGENKAPSYASALAAQFVGERDGVSVLAGGSSMIIKQISDQTKRDLVRMEAIAIPLSFLVLVWVFGGLVAASLPLLVGMMAILGAMSVLRLITHVAEVSVFALNTTIALGLALAIDYTLLIVSRYRDEIQCGAAREEALVRTMSTAGRTVVFSAVTVALSLAALLAFPMYFLKSFAYSGVATVAFAAAAAIFVTPAAIVVLDSRLGALDFRRWLRSALRTASSGRHRRPEPVAKPVEQLFWYRCTKAVMRRAIPIGVVAVAGLVFLGTPFLGIKFGSSDDRVLPKSASAHQVGDQLRNDFPSDLNTGLTVVVPDATDAAIAELDRYAGELSRIPNVTLVSAPGGTFAGGNLVGPPSAPTGVADGTAFLSLRSSAPLYSEASGAMLDQLHTVPGPGGSDVLIGGGAQMSRDIVTAVTSRMPLVLSLIAGITFVLLFLLTGSVILPLKAIILNVLSLSAAFGALVWVFQEGHLGALGTTPTGTMEASIPVLMFCMAFGLSMDYEVFLLARIREFWLKSGRTRADSDESVALGLARTGRVVTAAALIMGVAFAALIAAQVTFMRVLGLGLTLAVIVDATLVRMGLLPAFMRVMGKWNWWAPAPLVRLHERFGLVEEPVERDPVPPAPLATVGT